MGESNRFVVDYFQLCKYVILINLQYTIKMLHFNCNSIEFHDIIGLSFNKIIVS